MENIVKHPMKQWPNYELKEGATIEEMRQTAIRAMADELSFEWTPETSFTYQKTGACSNKIFAFNKGTLYVGLPYTTGGTGIFPWLQYYNNETGEFSRGPEPEFYSTLGNSCAACVNWGLSAVCSSIQGNVSTYHYTKAHNLIPLGEVDYDSSVVDFASYPTDRIVWDNGAKKVLEAYALLQPADAVVATDRYEKQLTDRHCMMCVEAPIVVRDENGNIDPEKSSVLLQDQWAKEQTMETKEGYTVSYRARYPHRVSFLFLLDKFYIAVSTEEFLGRKPYELAYAKADREVKTLDDLKECIVEANYRFACLSLQIRDLDGYVIYEEKPWTSGTENVDGNTAPWSLRVGDKFNMDAMKTAIEEAKKDSVMNTSKLSAVVMVVLANGAIKTALSTFVDE